MKIGVVIPLFNCEAYIGDALTSLLRQRGECQLAIVVANDGSTDEGHDGRHHSSSERVRRVSTSSKPSSSIVFCGSR